MAEILTHGYSPESAQRKLSNEYQNDRVHMVFENLCVLLLWKKVALALEGLISFLQMFHEKDITKIEIVRGFGLRLG